MTWNACEPAMTVVPSFLITGILAVFLGLLTAVWSGLFVQKRRDGLILIPLSVALLLFGGGIFPPLIGLIAGALATRTRRPTIPGRSRVLGRLPAFLASLWPWSLALYIVWVLGQWVIGYFYNDWLLAHGYAVIVMVLGTLLLALIAAVAHDRVWAGAHRAPVGDE